MYDACLLDLILNIALEQNYFKSISIFLSTASPKLLALDPTRKGLKNAARLTGHERDSLSIVLSKFTGFLSHIFSCTIHVDIRLLN